MRKLISKYKIVFFLIFIPFISFAQTSLDSLTNHNIILKEKLEENTKELNKLKELMYEKNSFSDTASNVIDYTSLIFSFIAFLITAVGLVTGYQISKVYHLRKKFEDTITSMQTDIDQERNKIILLKEEFEKEKKQSLDILFPILEGQMFYYQGDNDKAIQRFKEAQKIIPEHPIVINRLNRLLVDNGFINEAIENLEKLISEFPDNRKLHYRLAQAYRRDEQLDTAEEVIKEVLEKHEDPDCLYEYGTIRMLKGFYNESEKVFIKSNRLFIKDTGKPKHWVYTNLAISQLMNGNTDQFKLNLENGIKLLFDSLSRAPNHPNILGNIGISFTLTQNKEASNYFEESIKKGMPLFIAKSYLRRIKLIQNQDKVKFIVKPSLDILQDYITQKEKNSAANKTQNTHTP